MSAVRNQRPQGKELPKEQPGKSAPTAGPTASPGVSLTICSRNRPQLLLETVESVVKGNEVPLEIVIVDQSDQPNRKLEALGIIRGCQIRYFRERSAGVGHARNVAIAKARHDLLILTDDDMWVDPQWLAELVKALLRCGPGSVVTGQVRPAEEKDSGYLIPSTKVDQRPIVYEGRIWDDVLYTGNMAMFRSTFEEIGRFDERLGAGARFPAAYDNDFGLRLLQAGYKICYIPEAIVYHRHWRSEEDFRPLRWNYGRGQGAFYAKHLRLRDPFMLRRLTKHILRRFIWIFLRLLRQPRVAIGDAFYLSGLLSGLAEWLLTETRSGNSGRHVQLPK